MTAIGFLLVVLGLLTVNIFGERKQTRRVNAFDYAGVALVFLGIILFLAVFVKFLWINLP